MATNDLASADQEVLIQSTPVNTKYTGTVRNFESSELPITKYSNSITTSPRHVFLLDFVQNLDFCYKGCCDSRDLSLKLKPEASTTQTAHLVLYAPNEVEDLERQRDVCAGASLNCPASLSTVCCLSYDGYITFTLVQNTMLFSLLKILNFIQK